MAPLKPVDTLGSSIRISSVLIYLALIMAQNTLATEQKWHQTIYHQPVLTGADKDFAGEKVDRLASPTGDLFWRSKVEPGVNWFVRQEIPSGSEWRAQQQSKELESMDDSRARFNNRANEHTTPINSLYLDLLASPTANNPDGSGVGLRNYFDLVEEFKQYSRLANPSRESRAFKPKLMSTARGFGKRSSKPIRPITYGDLLEAANPNGALVSNGKMSEGASR